MQRGFRLSRPLNINPESAALPSAGRAPPGLTPPQSLVQDDHHGPGADAAPARILLVEDDFLIAMQVESVLIDAGYDVVGVAASADEAIGLAATHRPALAVMDIRLIGQRDGVDAALELYRDYGLRCIFATAHGDSHVKERASPAHPFNWLRKPYATASLIEAVKQALAELQHGRS